MESPPESDFSYKAAATPKGVLTTRVGKTLLSRVLIDFLRSDDRGVNWRTVSDGLPSQEVGAFAVHSYLPDTLYAWIAEQGIFRTEDGGGKWNLMDAGPDSPISMLAHSTYEGSMNTGWLYAATLDGPYLSMDCF